MNKDKKKSVIFGTAAAVYILACSIIFMVTDLPAAKAFVAPSPIHETTNENEIPENERININTATLDELITISGIGKATAEKIIEYREKNNGFIDVDELINVSGIGKNKLQMMRGYITA